MNIIELHERTRFWLDLVGSARFESSDIDNGLNIAQNSIVEEKYNSSQKREDLDSFQRTQKLRDELSSLVIFKQFSGANLTNSAGIPDYESSKTCLVKISSYPASYKYLLCIAVCDDDTVKHKYNCWPITYDRINIIKDNPFRKVRLTPIPKFYYIESSAGVTIYHLMATNAKYVDIYYLSNPIQMRYGIEYDSTHVFDIGNIIIVVSDMVVYNATTYQRGDKITIVPGVLQITSGTVVYDYIETNIPLTLHELISRKAAINCLLTIKEFDKAKSLIEYPI